MLMKSKLALPFALLLIAGAAQAQSSITNFSQTVDVNATVPDENINGLTSFITVSGMFGNVQDISVGLQLTNGYSGDYYAYLVDPAGDLFVLLNRPGVGTGTPFGYSDSGFNISLSSASTNNVHFYQAGGYTTNSSGQVTGTWQADGRYIDPASTPSDFNSAAITNGLNLAIGAIPNGTWTFFISDMSGGYEGTLVNWSLNITSVPEPSSAKLLLLMVPVGLVAGVLRRRYAAK